MIRRSESSEICHSGDIHQESEIMPISEKWVMNLTRESCFCPGFSDGNLSNLPIIVPSAGNSQRYPDDTRLVFFWKNVFLMVGCFMPGCQRYSFPRCCDRLWAREATCPGSRQWLPRVGRHWRDTIERATIEMINLKISKTQKPHIFRQLFIKSHCCFAKSTCLHKTSIYFNDTDESEPSYHSYPSRTPRMPCFGKRRCWLAQESSAPKPFVPRQGRRNTAEWVNRLWLACWDHEAKWSEWCSVDFRSLSGGFRGRLNTFELMFFSTIFFFSGCRDFFQSWWRQIP